MNPYSVLLKPILSEKSADQREDLHKYSFVVAMPSTKKDVKSAVEKAFDVKVANVHTVITRGKIKRRGMQFSKPSSSKKAIVTLQEGEKIALFEDQ